MATEKRLIDANALTNAIEHIDWYHISLQGTLAKGANSQLHTPLYKADDIYKSLEDAPAVDAVEVVRCKDCTNKRKAIPAENGQVIFCSIWGRGWCRVDPNDFCSYGERKDNA